MAAASIDNPALPFSSHPLPTPTTGTEDILIILRGSLSPSASWFCVNIQTAPGIPSQGANVGGDVLLHIRPDLPSRSVVRTYRMAGSWGQTPPPSDGFFPLTPSSPFEVMILIPPASQPPHPVKIAFNGAHFADCLLPVPSLPLQFYISIEGDPGGLSVHQMQVFFTPSATPSVPLQSTAGYPPMAGVPVPGAVPYPTGVPGGVPYPPPGAAYPQTPGYPSGGATSSSGGGMMGKILGTAATVPIVGGALAAASNTFLGKKLHKKMGKSGHGKSFGGIGPGGAAGLAAGALGTYVLAKKAKKLKKGFKFGHHGHYKHGSSSSSSSSSSSDSD